VKAKERSLRVRVKSLTNELAQFRRLVSVTGAFISAFLSVSLYIRIFVYISFLIVTFVYYSLSFSAI